MVPLTDPVTECARLQPVQPSPICTVLYSPVHPSICTVPCRPSPHLQPYSAFIPPSQQAELSRDHFKPVTKTDSIEMVGPSSERVTPRGLFCSSKPPAALERPLLSEWTSHSFPSSPSAHALKGFPSLQSGPLADFLGFPSSLSLRFLLVRS